MTRTNAFTLLCVAIRAIVVWVFASTLMSFQTVFFVMRSQGDREGLANIAIAAGISLVVMGLAWVFADKLARLALARPQDPVFESHLEPQAWLGLAISAIGAWFLFVALKDMAYLGFQWLMLSRAQVNVWDVRADTSDWLSNVVASVFELGLATVFLLRGQGLARLVHRWRYGRFEADSNA
jgi:hypothetical protein